MVEIEKASWGGIFSKIHYGELGLDEPDAALMGGASELETGPHPDEALRAQGCKGMLLG
ncbi:hypothetical protein GCM10023156_53520 [Novipirellula rosea]|uniref:Uncharacterized protein n=1 Tax=Novipirellula rosea TaxID=1031540 RepID=A0ABP8NHW3_9BACT